MPNFRTDAESAAEQELLVILMEAAVRLGLVRPWVTVSEKLVCQGDVRYWATFTVGWDHQAEQITDTAA